MLTVTLRDKDGGERQLSFEESEITIGRMDGNQIVLARNNISKRHASIMVVDGAILVADQRSTNGTYVNGRRLSAPHELTPQDKIYIGDFVLQVAHGTTAVESTSPQTQAADPPPMPPVSPGPTDHVGAEAALDALATDTEPPSQPAEEPPEIPTLAPEPSAEYLSEFSEVPAESADDLMSELEDIAPETMDTVGEADAAEAASAEEEEDEATRALSLDDIAALDSTPEAPAEVSSAEEPQEDEAAHALPDDLAALEPTPEEPKEPLLPAEEPPPLSDEIAATPSADDVSIVESNGQTAESVDTLPPFTVDEGLGVLTDLFKDSTVRGVQVNGTANVLIDRGTGYQSTDSEVPSSKELETTVAAAADALGMEADDARFVLSGTLPSGLRIDVIGTDFSVNGPLIVARRPSGHQATPQGLVEAGLEGPVLDQLGSFVKEGANVVVVGESGSGRTSIASSLAQLIDASERVAVIERGQDLKLDHPNVVRLDRDACIASGSLVEVLESLRATRVVFDDVSGPGVPDFFGLAAVGYRGLIGVMKASSAEELLKRLPNELTFYGHGGNGGPVRNWIADAIDVLVVTENCRIRAVVEVGSTNGEEITTRVVHGN